ncbi:MAG: CRTAC1 family protein [Gemmataceae bacterium]
MSGIKLTLCGVISVAALGIAGYFAYDRFFAKKVTAGPDVPIKNVPNRVAVPVPPVAFTDVTVKAGIGFTHFNGATGKKLLPETMGSGVVVIDYDNDGKPDLLFVNSCPWPGQPMPEKKPCLALYRNKGDGTFEDVTVAMGLNVTMYGVGACVGDYDNDGFPDVFIAGVGGDKLFHNDGGKKFTDVTAKSKVSGMGGWPEKENADQFFAHMPQIPFGSSATFLDYDGDGKLDLFVCRYVTWSPGIDLSIKSTLTGVGRTYQQPQSLEGNQCILYRNNGDGTFRDVSEEAGVTVWESEGTDAKDRKRPVGKSLGVVSYDADGDGWPDLVVANDGVRNFFFHNVSDGKGGRKFVETGIASNVAYADASPRGAMGIDVGEYLPGKCAIAIANFANEPMTFLECLNSKRIQFANKAMSIGLEGPSRGPLKFGLFFFDYDLDGRLDLLSCNGHIDPEIQAIQASQSYKQPVQLFWNTGEVGRIFEPVTSEASGTDIFRPIVGRGAAYLDFDGDGDLDVIVTENGGRPMLLRNDQKTGNHWVRLKLEGNGTTVNRSAIGAEVTIVAGGNTYHRSVAGSRGYLSQSELTVTVGLGKTDKIESVTVRWPGKEMASQTWNNLTVDRLHELKQQSKP